MARYETIVRNKFIAIEATTFDEFVADVEEHLDMLKRWREQGVQLDPDGVEDDYAVFYTEDREVARKLEFEMESTLEQ
jgi:hypothetical protein